MPFHRIRDPERLHALIDAMLFIEGDLELPAVLQHIVEQAANLVSARYAAMGVLNPEGTTLESFFTVGISEDERLAIGPLPTGKGLLGELVRNPEPLRLKDLSKHPASEGYPPAHPDMRSFLGVPVRVRGEVFGNLYLCEKLGSDEFSEEDEDLVSALGVTAGLVIDKARLHKRLRELTLVEERERLARNLHDTVIQQLFAAGLRLQSLSTKGNPPETSQIINEVIDDLDQTIRQIRTTIFAISPRRGDGSGGIRAEILEVTDELGGRLGLDVRVDFHGPIDAVIAEDAAEHLLLALREALSNVVRHASASRVEVAVSVTDRGIQLTVADDGTGMDPGSPSPGRGLANLKERAKLLRGECTIRPRPGGGTELIWCTGPMADQPERAGGDATFAGSARRGST